MSEILSYLDGRKGWIDGVTITGGEPTVNPGLEALLEQIVNPLGLRTKIDTNGSNPALIKRLIDQNLISAVSMDIKAPLDFESYSRVCGVLADIDNILHSIDIIKASGIDFFFRTTVVPGLVAERELAEIKNTIGHDTPYMIQPFRNIDTLDPHLKGFPEYEMERFESMKARYGTGLFS
jgi:pyruvate formate lyase activating enzyme